MTDRRPIQGLSQAPLGAVAEDCPADLLPRGHGNPRRSGSAGSIKQDDAADASPGSTAPHPPDVVTGQ